MKDVKILSSGMLAVSFKSPDPAEFYQLKEEIKSLPDRKWDSSQKHWEVPNIGFAREKLSELGFSVPSPDIRKVKDGEINPSLYEFQKFAVKKTGALNGRCLLAMEMGLGKTVVSLEYARIIEERPVIIVVPASVKLNWVKEIHKWTEGESPIIVSGRKPFYCKGFSMVIINYDILIDHVDYLLKLKPKILIADEVQMVKNTGAQRTRALKKLARNVDYMLALSGTPILSKPSEFWSILNMLRPDAWKRKIPYLYRYCGPENNGFVTVFNGATNVQELNDILNEEVMYRALKKDVLIQLPDKVFSAVPFEIDMRKYRMAERKLEQFLQNQGYNYAQALIRFNEMRNAAVEEKMPMVVQWINDFIETDGKLVVFCVHHKVIDHLMKEFSGKAVKIDGRDNQTKRDQSVQRFQDDDSVRLFVGNVEAAGVGIDGLQNASSNVAFVELPWVPAMVDQASDRLHRIGQEDSVSVYFLIADGTVEQDVAEAVDRKRAVLDAVLDGRETDEGSLIVELMGKYKG